MKAQDFIKLENGMSNAKSTNKPNLKQVQTIKFIKGSTQIYWKDSTTEQEFKSGEVLKRKLATKILKGKPESDIFTIQTEPRGITEKKRDEIIKNSGKLMPSSELMENNSCQQELTGSGRQHLKRNVKFELFLDLGYYGNLSH